MPSAYDNDLRVEKQAAGENLNTWGAPKLNQSLQNLIDALTKRLAFTLSGPKTLSTANGADDEARSAFLDIIGGTGGTVTAPSVRKWYIVRNAASGDVVITTGAGGTATVKPGEIGLVIGDGTNFRRLLMTDFGGSRLTNLGDPTGAQDAATKNYVDTQLMGASAGNLPGQPGNAGKFLTTDGSLASWSGVVVADVAGAAPTAAPSFTGGVTIAGGSLQDGSSKATPAVPAAANFDLSAADFFTKAINTNTTFTFSNTTASKAQAFVIELTISSGAVPTWPASVTWDGGVTPVFGNGVHLIGLISFNGGSSWRGMVGGRAFA